MSVLIVGLPPVTAEWFEARRSHLSSLQQQSADVVYICPLTNKKFQSEGTYENHTKTQKFKAALKKANMETVPPPKTVPRRAADTARPNGTNHGVQVARLQQHLSKLAVDEAQRAQQIDSDEDDDGESSGWETDSQIDDDTLATVRPIDRRPLTNLPGAA